MKNETDNYEDIIGLEHHVSLLRPHMPVSDRAVQFAPFAALNGHADALNETARITETAPELDENAKEELNEKLKYLEACGDDAPDAVFKWFVPDLEKSGGAFVTRRGKIRKTDTVGRKITLYDGTSFFIDALCDVELCSC